MRNFKLDEEENWRSLQITLLVLFVALHTSTANSCPLSEEILPCRCTQRGGEIQIWCSYGGLTNVLDALKGLAHRVRDPIDELIIESNNLPSLPGRTFDSLHVTRLMLRDNGLERVTSNWLASLENTLLELFIIEPRLRTLPADALEHLRTLEAVTLQGGIMKRTPRFSGLHNLRYIQLHSPVLMDLNPENFENLPNLEQIHVIGSPLLNKLDFRTFSNLMKMRLLNISNSGLSWLHPKSMTNLPSLKELILSMNRIADAGIIGRACRDLQGLQVLRLDNNFIDRLLEGSFVDLPSLRELHLSGNLISDIHHGAFRNTPSLKVLDLSKNLIKRVSPTAFMYPSGAAMEELWLTDNQLSQVSEMKSLFNALPRLRFLEMSRNHMEDIPFDVLHGHQTLERLHLNENRIRRIPNNQFGAIPTLRELRLRNNSLSDFLQGPSWNLPSLKGLDLSQNKFRRLDSRLLTYLPSLRRLDLSENFIDNVIPDSFVGTLELETLNLSKNFISQIHSLTFSHLPKLFEIDASSNRLREVIPGLPTNLEYLRLSNNQIFTLPSAQLPDLNLPSLRLLDISGNSLQTIPQDSFREMSQLQYLYLNENALQTIDDGALNGLSRLEHLNIRNNRIRDFTNDCLKGLKSLKEINLDGNFVESLNSDVTKHSPILETFHLSKNRLMDISRDSFSTARKLQELDVSHNHLTKIPEALQGLSMLEVLDLSHNQIQSLQAFSFNQLPSLTELKLGSNKLRELPEDTFRDLPKLAFLDLENNNLELISPGAIKSLPSLIAVRFSQNSLTRLNDESFVDLPELQSAELQYNRLEEISDHALVNVPHLALLNLSNNFLAGLEKSGINELRSLEVLDVSHNRLSLVESRALNGMEWLVELKIDNNIICNINGAPFNNLQRLRVLSLKNNKMTTVSESAFQRLRNNIAVFDIDGNPLSCSCKMVWLQSWLKDSSSEGPRCADGTLFRDARLSRSDCSNSRVVEPVVPGCESEFIHIPTEASVLAQYSALSENKNDTLTVLEPPAPNESEYFYDEYVEYQYEEVNNTDQLNLNNSTINYVQVNTIEPESTVSTHYVSGDTPTIYAGTGNTIPVPNVNITNPGLGYNDLKKAQTPQQQYNGLTFFGIPLPSLSLGNIWKGNAGRSSESHPGKVQFTGTRGKAVSPGKAISRSGTISNEGVVPPDIEKGGFVPMLPGTGGFKPVLDGETPVSSSGWEYNNTFTEVSTDSPDITYPRNRVPEILLPRSKVPETPHKAEITRTQGTKIINRGRIEPVAVKRPDFLTQTTAEEETTPHEEIIPVTLASAPIANEVLSPQPTVSHLTVNPNDIYNIQDTEEEDIYFNHPRYLTDRTYEHLQKSTAFPEVTTEYTRPSEYQNDWYFQNYNKTNLQPYIGSNGQQSSQNSLLYIFSIILARMVY